MQRPHISVAQRGFSLIEVLVAMLIGMIAIVVVMQVFAVSEGYKRTTSGGSDAQVNGGLALYLMEREIRMAGYGISDPGLLGCPAVRVWNSTLGTTSDVRMTPFEVNPVGVGAGADANTDVILIAFGVADTSVVGVPIDQANVATASFALKGQSFNRDGFRTGDLVIATQGTQCGMYEVTFAPGTQPGCLAAVYAGPAKIDALTGTYKNYYNNCGNTTAVHNKATPLTTSAGAPFVAFSQALGGQVFNLGQSPVIKAYAVYQGALATCDMVNANCTNASAFQPVVSDIVSLRAVYMKDTSNPLDGVIDVVDHVRPVTATDWASVQAVQIEVTARSGLKEKQNAANACDITIDKTKPDLAQTWMGQGVAGAGIDLSTTSADWACYRYKMFQTSIPLRNMIWTH